MTEETSLPPPDHLYTKTKVSQEHLLMCWNEHYGVPYTILRYDIPYGPGMRSNMAIAIFARKAMYKERISVFGDGTQGRCFIYIEDLAEGNTAALNRTAENQILNLAGTEFITLNQVIQSLKEIFGEVDVEYRPSRPQDFKGVRVNIEKAKRLLNWAPKRRLNEGLRRYITYLGKRQSEAAEH